MKKILITLLSFHGALLAQGIPNYLDVAIGYRNDQINNNRVTATDSSGDLVLDETLNIKNLNVYEIGAKVRYEPFCHLFGRGSCYIGWLNGGSYSEKDFIDGTLSHVRSSVNHGETVNWDLEGGYQFDFCLFGIAPIFGWSYDYLDIRMKKAVRDGETDPFLSGLRYTTYWKGPFVGLDVFVNLWDFLIEIGYEYHWSHWRGRYFLPIPNDPGVVFSNIRNSHNGTGNIFYIDLIWNFFCSWDLGLSYKYTDYTTKGGNFSPYMGTFATDGFPEIVKTDVPKAEWLSHQVTLDLRYSF